MLFRIGRPPLRTLWKLYDGRALYYNYSSYLTLHRLRHLDSGVVSVFMAVFINHTLQAHYPLGQLLEAMIMILLAADNATYHASSRLSTFWATPTCRSRSDAVLQSSAFPWSRIPETSQHHLYSEQRDDHPTSSHLCSVQCPTA